ncbi:3-hexulose-6-phosphate isomerase [Halobacillus karajensis]|uniref:3-hexulose-6-phosphate isomerase n=1 Tax=Halobacillus karajensis TaxID=195088 RepID=A0A059NYS9_9BACI|nr:6-phospho-3-hexuloisomerase [Halobacillus karajensis]CDQ18522.1 3-hexulose-6-phosphate isomerase [Halobacillus karajensis]CDQ23406.1 3-hexulose-6-phosphate isomerase [Halobacillus karajensis]CDQ26888.1 3-hexulose-6-phosphate isomerase [Halobacillus karajensis]SEH50415.1 3-hexulose-6-phosphate isomerase [Halobacillus karajensis]
MKQIIQTVSDEIRHVLSTIEAVQAAELSDHLFSAPRVFVSGEGRSGLMGKAFAMRLMHAGFTVYVTGETITPSIEKGDLLVVISGSGSTQSLHQFARQAKEAGAVVAAVTTNPQSVIAEGSDLTLVVPAATKKRLPEEPDTIQPLGNQFDQSVHLLLDAVIIHAVQQQEGHTHEQMAKRHANLE